MVREQQPDLLCKAACIVESRAFDHTVAQGYLRGSCVPKEERKKEKIQEVYSSLYLRVQYIIRRNQVSGHVRSRYSRIPISFPRRDPKEVYQRQLSSSMQKLENYYCNNYTYFIRINNIYRSTRNTNIPPSNHRKLNPIVITHQVDIRRICLTEHEKDPNQTPQFQQISQLSRLNLRRSIIPLKMQTCMLLKCPSQIPFNKCRLCVARLASTGGADRGTPGPADSNCYICILLLPCLIRELTIDLFRCLSIALAISNPN